MKYISKILVFAGLAFAFASCASADITWTLNDVNLVRPGLGDNTITGFFTVDTGLDAVTNWDVLVTGTNTGADTEYTPVAPGVIYGFDNSSDVIFGFHPATPPNTQFLILDFATPLTNAGGTVDLTGASLACDGCSTLTSGYIVGAPAGTVPEPRFGAVLLLGLAGLGFLTRRKFAAARS
jgi:hypothetical protein